LGSHIRCSWCLCVFLFLALAGALLDGLLGIVATGVSPNDKRPSPDHPFIAPGPTDQRGVCPGLNTLANHGYLPRNGIVNAGQIVQATKEGFNMAEDLSSLLNLIAIAFGGNLATETFSIGGEDDRTYSASGIGSKAFGRQYGLNGHSRCEGDASALREDFYLNNVRLLSQTQSDMSSSSVHCPPCEFV
jgi:hypothetical protein